MCLLRSSTLNSVQSFVSEYADSSCPQLGGNLLTYLQLHDIITGRFYIIWRICQIITAHQACRVVKTTPLCSLLRSVFCWWVKFLFDLLDDSLYHQWVKTSRDKVMIDMRLHLTALLHSLSCINLHLSWWNVTQIFTAFFTQLYSEWIPKQTHKIYIYL